MSCIEQNKGKYVARKPDGSFKRKGLVVQNKLLNSIENFYYIDLYYKNVLR